LFVSQSGETADTLACLRDAKACGQKTLALTNCAESSMAREADSVIVMPAGPEIGVAATKTFTAQLTALACLAVAVGRSNGAIEPSEEQRLMAGLAQASSGIEMFLRDGDGTREGAALLSEARDAIYLGRGLAYPLALEGALKLKEISYVHAEGFAAGEMKHGPIALIDDGVPVVIVAPPDELFDKVASNIHEVSARGGRIIMISDAAGHARVADHRAPMTRIVVPPCDPFAAPLLYAVPMQLLAYHAACLRGTDVDQPRNLAKSVTVE
jgi:glucosamine--fructose-6-phosphate aminotransferase (isomerizing)